MPCKISPKCENKNNGRWLNGYATLRTTIDSDVSLKRRGVQTRRRSQLTLFKYLVRGSQMVFVVFCLFTYFFFGGGGHLNIRNINFEYMRITSLGLLIQIMLRLWNCTDITNLNSVLVLVTGQTPEEDRLPDQG